MSFYRQSPVWLLGIGLLLLGLLGMAPSPDVAAQDGEETLVALKAQAWSTAGLATLPLLPGLELEPPATPLTVAANGGYWKRIAFQSYRDGNWEIYWMDQYGEDQRRITHHSAPDVRPRLSFDLNRVVFASRRDGNWEIYAANTDGTGLLRLTNTNENEIDPALSPNASSIAFSRIEDNRARIYRMGGDGRGQIQLTSPQAGIFDIGPAWSPDNQKIAWIRTIDGEYGDIMVMQADGSNQRVIARRKRFVQNIAFSPNGQFIAFDADNDWNNRNDILIINNVGDEIQKINSSGGLEYWMGSWSNNNEIIFTEIRYEIRDNRLYIAEAHLKKVAFDPSEWTNLRPRIAFPGSGLDAVPDWQRGVDTQPPTATIQALPAVSPAPIAVRWSGTDAGPSGIVSYDVQVREDDGAWTDWLSATEGVGADYPGRGGRRYAFRVRARDDAGNLSPWTDERAAQTTVENLPPRVAFTFTDDPAFLRYGGKLTWQGDDPGGSGIAGYDLQYRVADGEAWLNWQDNTPEPWAYFYGEVGKRYFLRLRARDRAGNVSAWQETRRPGTVYRWGITGTVYDNRHRPLEGVHVTSTPPGAYGGISDATGAYSLYSLQEPGPYAVRWQKDGYGSPPVTAYPGETDARTEVVLPPLDNIVSDPSLEQSASSPWQFGGVYPPRRQTQTVHTGAQAALLGLMPFAVEPMEVPTTKEVKGLRFMTDEQGNKHLFWYEEDGYLYHARIGPDGAMSPVKRLSKDWRTQIVVGRDGTVHAVWNDPLTGYAYPFYAVGRPDGTWSQRKLDVPTNEYRIAVDARGVFHILYLSTRQYQQRLPDGRWSPIEEGRWPLWSPRHVLVTPNGTLYLLFQEGYGEFVSLVYVVRRPDGRWESPRQLPVLVNSSYNNKLVVRADNENNLHLLLLQRFYDKNQIILYYIKLKSNNEIFYQKIFTTQPYYRTIEYNLFVKDKNNAFIVIYLSDNKTITIKQILNNDQKEDILYFPQNISPGITYAIINNFIVVNNRIYTSFVYFDGIVNLIYLSENKWILHQLNRNPCTNLIAETASGALVVDTNDIPHLAWTGYDRRCRFYLSSLSVPRAGSSRLQQSMTIPHTLNAPTLSFFYRFPKPYPSPSALQVQVHDGSRTTTVFTAETGTWDWTQAWVDMTPWAGRTITLTFDLPQIAGAIGAWAEVDDVTLGSAAYPDLWVAAPALTPAPGETFRFHLAYGNGGDGIGYGTQLTLTLPSSLLPVAADPPPAATPGDRIWRWDAGALAPQELSRTLTITATAPLTLTAGSVLTGTWRIASTSPELNRQNNAQTFPIWVGGRALYLPVLVRTGRVRATAP